MGVGFESDDGVVVGIYCVIRLVIEIVEETGMAIEEAETAFGADGEVIAGQSFEAINKIVREGIVVGLMKELGDLRAVEAVQAIGGCDPEKALIVLSHVGDGIAAETFGG